MLPLPLRAPADRLRHAREDHAICLRLAASYRQRTARGERGLTEQHAWALAHCKALRGRFSDFSRPN
ncbi:hypothetical protein [Methylobacterium sp. A54F]